MTNSEPDILFERRGVAGHVILNRPHALNAVSHDMVCTLAQKLDEWETDPAITRIVVSAKGGRAFSAGGDLRALYDLGRAAGMRTRSHSFARNMRLMPVSSIIASRMWR